MLARRDMLQACPPGLSFSGQPGGSMSREPWNKCPFKLAKIEKTNKSINEYLWLLS